jgi:predicted Zn-dependent protease
MWTESPANAGLFLAEGVHRESFRGRVARRVLGMLFALGVITAGAHPDLLEQIERLDAEVARAPGDAALLLQRGDLNRRHGDFAAAEADFAAARALQPDLPEQDFAEGRLLLEVGLPAAADQRFSRFLEVHPQHASAWNLRGRARLAQGQPGLAAQDYARAIEFSDAPSPALYHQQAAALALAGTAHWQDARQALAAGLARHPQDVALRGLATDLALALGQDEVATAEMAQLPEPLHRLPQWQRRIELAACGAAGGSAAEACAQQAWTRLWDELDRWLCDQRGASQATRDN